MQRWSSKLRSVAALYPPAKSSQPYSVISSFTPSRSLISTYSSPNLAAFSGFKSLLNDSRFSQQPSFFPHPFMQVRHITAKQRKRKLKSRQPMTPITSKLKKIKMKAYSSFKGRFRVMKDGLIRRWKEGKRHNATSKSKKARRRLRRPGTVPLAYEKVMKKLNFRG